MQCKRTKLQIWNSCTVVMLILYLFCISFYIYMIDLITAEGILWYKAGQLPGTDKGGGRINKAISLL